MSQCAHTHVCVLLLKKESARERVRWLVAILTVYREDLISMLSPTKNSKRVKEGEREREEKKRKEEKGNAKSRHTRLASALMFISYQNKLEIVVMIELTFSNSHRLVLT